MTIGTNYVGHWYLTHLLLDPLKAAAPSRVVFVSSASETAPPPIDWDNIMRVRGAHMFGIGLRSIGATTSQSHGSKFDIWYQAVCI